MTNIKTPMTKEKILQLIKGEGEYKDLNINERAKLVKSTPFANFDFITEHLLKAFFYGAHLENVNFTGAHLELVNFNESYAAGAKFEAADLTKAKFVDAELPSANFKKANVQDMDVKGANLNYADFREARNFQTIQNLEKAKNFMTVKLDSDENKRFLERKKAESLFL